MTLESLFGPLLIIFGILSQVIFYKLKTWVSAHAERHPHQMAIVSLYDRFHNHARFSWLMIGAGVFLIIF